MSYSEMQLLEGDLLLHGEARTFQAFALGYVLVYMLLANVDNLT
jgi:hypothetical protein